MVKIGSGDSVKVSVTVRNGDCTTSSTGEIKVMKPPVITSLSVSGGVAGAPATVIWGYDREPTAQTLSGTDLSTDYSIPPGQHTFTYIPREAGEKTIVLKAQSGPINPSGLATSSGRRRSAQVTPVSASECVDVIAASRYTILPCNPAAVTITAPQLVQSGVRFTARASIAGAAGDPAFRWTVSNGTIDGSTDGSEVAIIPASDGTMSIGLRVTFSDSCVRAVTKTINVGPACLSPRATISAGSKMCQRMTLVVSFTGRPPFSGTWNDGPSFSTPSSNLSRDVTEAGTYTLRTFHDATCDGTINGSVVFDGAPSATIAMRGSSCTDGTVVATFSGQPPFTGVWSDTGEKFVTSQRTLEHKVKPGDYYYHIGDFHDALCEGLSRSNVLEIPEQPIVMIDPANACAKPGQPASIYVRLPSPLPGRIKWSDGLVQTLTDRDEPRRDIPFDGTKLRQTYSIVEASNAMCTAIIGGQPSVVTFSDVPEITLPQSSDFICHDLSSTAALVRSPVAGVPIVWSVTNGQIVSGQGTAALTWKAIGPGDVSISCRFDYPDSCVTIGVAPFKPHVWSIPAPPVVTAPTFETTVGGSLRFTLDFDSNIDGWSASTGNSTELSLPSCVDHPDMSFTCTSAYTNNTGPGTKTVKINYQGRCGEALTKSFNIIVH